MVNCNTTDHDAGDDSPIFRTQRPHWLQWSDQDDNPIPIIPQEIAWRIFTKGIDRESALLQVKVSGDTQLGLHALQVISIVA